ncbi:hypothetical protein CVV70_14595 [Ralstonia solanacearum]|nr:hypothetical protein CCY86_20040 [Ralstonia solanacearum]OPK47883.1 hypothetical protein B5G54_12210 [Ralstonia solanacearum]OPK53855.1 hypothetical protein B5J95_14760 [Ralstonia solanacearum]OPK54461.1 hypothetical protein B5S37_12915 [Ralstonia solanacearum]OYQ02620.1 hypothetical protein B7R79_21055 [Ralstonia solanacearum]
MPRKRWIDHAVSHPPPDGVKWRVAVQDGCNRFRLYYAPGCSPKGSVSSHPAGCSGVPACLRRSCPTRCIEVPAMGCHPPTMRVLAAVRFRFLPRPAPATRCVPETVQLSPYVMESRRTSVGQDFLFTHHFGESNIRFFRRRPVA